MFTTDDTIVAAATPPGRGGIGVVRISGPASASIARVLTGLETLEPRHATLATVVAADQSPIDRGVVTFFAAPHSYTGEDVVEISAHGSPVVVHAIVAAASTAGARLANPGEFTLRAYLHGRMDLVQAEAVAELIDAVTPLQARVAFDQLDGTLTSRLRGMDGRLLDLIARLEASLDFPDEGYRFVAADEAGRELDALAAELDALLRDATRGRMIREGVTAAIVGRPNAGKSSLFNRLAGASRAIVTDVPGTTRDLLTERVDVDGVPVTFVDTAGVRLEPGDPIEKEGIARAKQAAASAGLTIVVLDRSMPLMADDRALLADVPVARVLVASKSDLPAAWDAAAAGALPVSSVTGDGIAELRRLLVAQTPGETRDLPVVTNLRHVRLLEKARAAVGRAVAAAREATPEEFVLADLHEARGRFDEMAGARPQDEVLRLIFERFCIGK